MKQRLTEAFSFLFWAVVFGVAYTQAPLYYSNQNQYFLHGLAHAGHGYLERDWLANTRDPTPVFSAGVAFTYRHLDERFFYLYYLLLQGLYFCCLVGICSVVTGLKPGSGGGLCLMAVLIVIHSGLLRLISAQSTGIDYPWFLQCGLAGQYILGFGLQPSVFGVLLVASVYAFVRDCPFRAAIGAAVGAIVHATYLLGSAMLVLTYIAVLTRKGPAKRALGVGLLALALVTPVVIYNAQSFAPTERTVFAKAQHILAHFRIPHHAEIGRWLDPIALAQIGWMIAGIALSRRSPLSPIMLGVFLLSLLLTLVQAITGNDSLALLFPWRASAILIPLATTVILGRLTICFQPWLVRCTASQTRALQAACGIVITAVTAGGAVIMLYGLGYHSNDDELPLLNYVRTHKQEGDTYLLPVSVPKSGSGSRGVFSTNFTPAPRPGTHLIAIDLQRFRLYTGAPILVDFKSIPYQDLEVLQWKKRLDWNHRLSTRRQLTDIAELNARGITHVVAARDRPFRADTLEQVYADRAYIVYRVAHPAGRR